MAAIFGLWLIASALLVWYCFPGRRLLRPNYTGSQIPVGMGLLMSIFLCPVLTVYAIWDSADRTSTISAVILIVVFACTGIIDDFAGDRTSTGIKGHLKALLLHKRITTGLVKLVGGGIASLAVAFYGIGRPWPWPIVDGAIIALSANLLNLFDLRPGRACAVFLIGAIILGSSVRTETRIATRLLGWSLPPWVVLYEWDKRAQAMMGDAGSNVLGAILGYAAVTGISSMNVRILLLLGLILMHIVTEIWSLNRLIERTPLLRWIDRRTGVRDVNNKQPL